MTRAIPVGDAPQAATLSPYQAYLLYDRATRTMRAGLRQALEPLDLSVIEWVILSTVKDAGRQYISMTALAAISNKPLSQTSVVVQGLIERRLVRQKMGTTDLRSRSVVCTAGGRRILFRASQQVAPSLLSFKGSLTQDDYERCLKLLAQTLL